jgi:hypothetical protein
LEGSARHYVGEKGHEPASSVWKDPRQGPLVLLVGVKHMIGIHFCDVDVVVNIVEKTILPVAGPCGMFQRPRAAIRIGYEFGSYLTESIVLITN